MKSVYKIVFTTSLVLLTLAIISILVFGLRLGADFTGGSVMQASFSGSRPSLDAITQTVSGVSGVHNVNVSPVADKGMIVRMDSIDETTHQSIVQALDSQFGQIQESSFSSIGPTIGGELEHKSITAIIVLLIVIMIYIAFVFRKLSSVLSPWAMGLAAIIALIHDVVIPVGIFAVLGHYAGVEISAVFVAAALTILGFSVSDTVIVFDRVRENILRYGSKSGSFADTVHQSIKQTLTRSINTTVAVIMSLLAIFFFGGDSVHYFALAMAIGIFFGAYSSFFVASPILVWLTNWQRSRRQ